MPANRIGPTGAAGAVVVALLAATSSSPVAGAAGPQIDLVERTRIQTPYGQANVAPLDGLGSDAFALVHRRGDVTLYDGDGDILWSRPSMSFFDDWGIEPWEGRTPRVLMTASVLPWEHYEYVDPLDAHALRSERPFDVGDLTGDGVEDLAIAHSAAAAREDGSGYTVTAVSVLDGRDGSTVWHRVSRGAVTQVLVHGDRLVIGLVSGDSYEPGSTSTLEALRLGPSGGSLAAAGLWVVDTGVDSARWLAVEAAGPGAVAAAWSRGTSGSGGTVLLVDAETGENEWTWPTTGFPRTIRFDATREQVVVHEQVDPSSSPAHAITGLRLADGTEAGSVSRPGAVLVSLEVEDVAGSDAAEWVIGEYGAGRVGGADLGSVEFPGVDGFALEMRVASVDPDTGATLWEVNEGDRTSSSPVPQSIAVVQAPAGPRLIVASVIDNYDTTADERVTFRLQGYDGATGAVLWSHEGNPLRGEDPGEPPTLAIHRLAGRSVAMMTTFFQGIRAYDVADGSLLLEAPTLAGPLAVLTDDVDADGTTDLIAGTQAGGVFALDGDRLGRVPGVIWRAAAGGPVRELQLADLDGDGRDEVVVVTANGVEVLNIVDGVRRYRIEYPSDDAFTVATGDLSGDGLPDLVVPTTRLEAFGGRDGELLWEYPPGGTQVADVYFSNAVVTGDGEVATQYLVHSASNVSPTFGGPWLQRQFLTVIDGGTGVPVWTRGTDPSPGLATGMQRWRAVAALPGDVRNAAFTYEHEDELPLLDHGTLWFGRPGVYAHASDDGDELWRGRAAPAGGHVQHYGTIVRGQRVLEFNDRVGLLSAGPGGSWEVHIGPTTDVADADFGPLGSAFVAAQPPIREGDGWRVLAFPPGAPDAPGTPLPLAVRHVPFGGRLLSADLDGDGADEVITLPFDRVGFWSITHDAGLSYGVRVDVARRETVPQGISVLEAVEG